MTVSKRLRFEILRRDNHTCRYCGGKTPDVTLTVDHVVPVTLGGQDVPENLVSCCADCNAGKSATVPDADRVADVAEDAIRWRKAMEIAQQLAAEERSTMATYTDAFNNEWMSYTYVIPSYRSGTGKEVTKHCPLPLDWEKAVRDLVVAGGLSVADLVEGVRTTMAMPRVKDEFRYFMGVMNNRVAERQAIARRLLERGEI